MKQQKCVCGHFETWHKENGMSTPCRKPSCEFSCEKFEVDSRGKIAISNPGTFSSIIAEHEGHFGDDFKSGCRCPQDMQKLVEDCLNKQEKELIVKVQATDSKSNAKKEYHFILEGQLTKVRELKKELGLT